MSERNDAAHGAIPTLGEVWLPIGPTRTVVTAHLVRVRDVAAYVPAGIEIVRVVPGWTVASTLLSFYGPGSTLEYNELVIAPALVRAGGARGAWVSHIWVDSDDSIIGGRRMGLPKESARFAWDEERHRRGRCLVSAPDGTPIASVSYGVPRLSVPWALRGAAVSVLDDGTVVHFGSLVRARWGAAGAVVHLPATSPAAGIPLGGALVSLVSGPMRGEMGLDLRRIARVAPRAEPLLDVTGGAAKSSSVVPGARR